MHGVSPAFARICILDSRTRRPSWSRAARRGKRRAVARSTPRARAGWGGEAIGDGQALRLRGPFVHGREW